MGEPVFPGAAGFEGEGEDRCLSVCVGGQDISGTNEEAFTFVHTETTGDVVITGRVTEVTSPDANAKVGVMLRESRDQGAIFAAMFYENGHFRFSYRDTPQGRVTSRQGSRTRSPDAWVQIRHEGTRFTGLSSPDGVNWTQVKSVQFEGPTGDLLGGVAATGVDRELRSSFEPLTATVCDLEISSEGMDGPFDELEFLDLSDIIAGGDGTGAPEDATYVGVHLDTGEFLDDWENAPTIDADGVNPAEVEESVFIDSVFFIDQADLPISTADVVFDFDPVDTFNSGWNHVLANITGDLLSAGGVIQAGDRTDLETCVGLIAAAGVTFDLESLRAEHGADAIHTFSSYIGMDGGKDGCHDGGFMTLSVIFSNEDEILMDPTTPDGTPWKLRVGRGIGAPYEAVIPPEATFLTLVSGAGNNSFVCDHGTFGDPRIHPMPEPVGTRFRRGDPTSDGTTNVSDPLAILNYLFADGQTPGCIESADVDNSGVVNLSDPVLILAFLFEGGPAPAPPFDSCGTDTGEDELSCESYPPCTG